MEKQELFVVLKRKDIARYLSAVDQHELTEIMRRIQEGRLNDGKPLHKYVCIQENWPMYDLTWKTVELWVDKGVDIDYFNPFSEGMQIHCGESVHAHSYSYSEEDKGKVFLKSEEGKDLASLELNSDSLHGVDGTDDDINMDDLYR